LRYFVEPWHPAFGSPQDADDGGTGGDSSAELDLDVELPADKWRPVSPGPGADAPPTVLLVDGVRRIDAHLWVQDDEGEVHPAVAVSYAAGVVRCDLHRGVAEVAHAQLRRGLFTPATGATMLGAPPAGYRLELARGSQHDDLVRAAQQAMLALEATVSEEARAQVTDLSMVDDDLLVTDGPLRGRHRLPRSLGYVKTHRTHYLRPKQAKVVTECRAGQRSPVFRVGPRWPHYSWYLRLPGPAGSPWAGVVRVQGSPDLTPEQAVALADRSAVTLPRFASRAYKDPRAPQNLVPVAGLERRLRALLGDPKLLHRSLLKATA
jgi:hypothetical protein